MPVHPGEVVIRIADTPREADLCAFASGLFEQMAVLSGGHAAHVEHERCEARGDNVCLYRATWERSV
jgi:predicted hydrocarbon binding protein